MESRNGQARIAALCAGIAVLGAVGTALLLVSETDWMDGTDARLAALYVSTSITVIALIGTLVYGMRARILAKLLAQQDLLAHWIYSEQEVREETELELGEARRARWGRFAVGVGALFVNGLAYCAFHLRLARFVLAFVAGATVLSAAETLLEPKIRAARRRRASPEAFVSRDAAYVLGELRTWKLPGVYVEVAVVTKERRPSLRVEYSQTYTGRRSRDGGQMSVSIPIPPGEEERAHAAALAIMGVPRRSDVVADDGSKKQLSAMLHRLANAYRETREEESFRGRAMLAVVCALVATVIVVSVTPSSLPEWAAILLALLAFLIVGVAVFIVAGRGRAGTPSAPVD